MAMYDPNETMGDERSGNKTLAPPAPIPWHDALKGIESNLSYNALKPFDFYYSGAKRQGHYLPVYSPTQAESKLGGVTSSAFGGQTYNFEQGQYERNPFNNESMRQMRVKGPDGQDVWLTLTRFADGTIAYTDVGHRPLDMSPGASQFSPFQVTAQGFQPQGAGPTMYQGEKVPVKVGNTTVFEDRYDPNSYAAQLARQSGSYVPTTAPIGQDFAKALQQTATATNWKLPKDQDPNSPAGRMVADAQKNPSQYGGNLFGQALGQNGWTPAPQQSAAASGATPGAPQQPRAYNAPSAATTTATPGTPQPAQGGYTPGTTPAAGAAPNITRLSGQTAPNFRDYLLSAVYPQFAPMTQDQMTATAMQRAALQVDPATAALRRELDQEGLAAKQGIESLTGASFQRLLDINRQREKEARDRAMGTQNAMGRVFSPLGRGEVENAVRDFRQTEGTLLTQQAEQAGRIGEQFNLRQQQLRQQVVDLEARKGQIASAEAAAIFQSERAAAQGDVQTAMQFAQQAQQLRQQAQQVDNQNAIAMAELQESQRRTDLDATLKREGMTQNESQFGRSFGLQERELGERVRQFDAGTPLREQQTRGARLEADRLNQQNYLQGQFDQKYGTLPMETQMQSQQAQVATQKAQAEKAKLEMDIATGKADPNSYAVRLRQAELDQILAQTDNARAQAERARRPDAAGDKGMTASQLAAEEERLFDNVSTILTSPALDGDTKIDRINALIGRHQQRFGGTREAAMRAIGVPAGFETKYRGQKASKDAISTLDREKGVIEATKAWQGAEPISYDSPEKTRASLQARQQLAKQIWATYLRPIGMSWEQFTEQVLVKAGIPSIPFDEDFSGSRATVSPDETPSDAPAPGFDQYGNPLFFRQD